MTVFTPVCTSPLNVRFRYNIKSQSIKFLKICSNMFFMDRKVMLYPCYEFKKCPFGLNFFTRKYSRTLKYFTWRISQIFFFVSW